MSENVNACQSCSHENKFDAKFCVACGATFVAISQEKLDKFKYYLEDMLSDGDDPRNNEVDLIEEAVEDMGIPFAQAKRIFELVCITNKQSSVGVKITYDSQLAKAGVAQGNTSLVIKIENLTNKSIGSVTVDVVHPEDGSRINLGKVRSLGALRSKTLEATLQFNLVGVQLIRDGQIKVESLSGLMDVYLFASPIKMSTENSNAARNTHISNSQTITTSGGGVVDGSGFRASESSATAVSAVNIEHWENVRLRRSNFQDKPAPPENIQTTTANTAAEYCPTSLKEISTPLGVDESTKSEMFDDTSDLGPEMLGLINQMINQGDHQGAKLFAINEFIRLLSLYPKAQATQKGKVYSASGIDLDLLTNIASASKIKRADIHAIIVNKASGGCVELEYFEGGATVFSNQGLITLTAVKNRSIELVDRYEWSFLKKNSWGVFRQSISTGRYIFSLGEEATDYCLPNLTFDLRKNNERIDCEQIYCRLNELFEKIKSFSELDDKETLTENAGENGNDETLGLIIEDEVMESQIEDELEFAVKQFFTMFAFTSQFCDQSNDRPIHIYVEEENGGDVDLDLARSVQSLFPQSKIIAICEDDPASTHDAEGRIINWTGLASIITRDGIFNATSDGQCNFNIVSKQGFLSWSKFFNDLKSKLIVRHDVPDIWLGNQDYCFIKGAYIDYSEQIDSFIYYEDFFHKDLNERFEIFRELSKGTQENLKK